MAGEATRCIEDEFGYNILVVLRFAKKLRSVVTQNPFASEAEKRNWHVGFLADTPGKKSLQTLEPNRSVTDRFEVRGQEVFLYVPGGMARTKLTTGYFDRRLQTTMTVRDWRTVGKLIEMTS